MSTAEDDNIVPGDQTPSVAPGNYSPVTVSMSDTVAAVFLALLALVSLIGWMRAEARCRALLTRQN